MPHLARCIISAAQLALFIAGDLSGRDDVAGLGAKAAQQLTQQVTVVTAPGIMTLALQMNNKQLQVQMCLVFCSTSAGPVRWMHRQLLSYAWFLCPA